MASSGKNINKWIFQADAYMLKNYLITLTEDIGLSLQELQHLATHSDSPETACEFLAAKFDLASVQELRANWMLPKS